MRRDLLLSHVTECLSPERQEKLRISPSVLVDVLLDNGPQPSLPDKQESAAIAIRCPKVAALAFDRVWTGRGGIPPEIAFFGDTSLETKLTILKIAQQAAFAALDRKEPQLSMCDAMSILFDMAWAVRPLDRLAARRFAQELFDLDMLAPVVARALRQSAGVHAVPLFASDKMRSAAFSKGDRTAITAILSGIQTVDEDALGWDQVLEFRRDSEARRKYRRFVHWLDDEMVGRDVGFIIDEVNARCEDYDWALRKHGLRVITGALTSIADPRTLIAGSAAFAAASFLHKPVASLIAAGAILLARGVLRVTEELIELTDLRTTMHPEIAFVHELQRSSTRSPAS